MEIFRVMDGAVQQLNYILFAQFVGDGTYFTSWLKLSCPFNIPATFIYASRARADRDIKFDYYNAYRIWIGRLLPPNYQKFCTTYLGAPQMCAVNFMDSPTE